MNYDVSSMVDINWMDEEALPGIQCQEVFLCITMTHHGSHNKAAFISDYFIKYLTNIYTELCEVHM